MRNNSSQFWMSISVPLLLLLLLIVNNVQSANILGYLASPGRSLFTTQDALLRGLAEKGHNVTVVSIWPARQPMPATYHYIQLEMTPEEKLLMDDSKQNLMSKAENNTKQTHIIHLPRMLAKFNQMQVNFLQRPEVERLKREEKFDLVAFTYFMNDYQLGLAGHFRCPSILLSSVRLFKATRDVAANPSTVAYIQHPMISDGKSRMTFLGRVFNYFIETLESLAFTYAEYFVYWPHYEKLFPPDTYPSLDEVRKNISLVFVNSHLSQGNSPPTMPNVIEVSGMHIKDKPNELPKHIKQWLDDAKDGAIFFSFGTNIDPSLMNDDKRNMILTAFSKLKQRVLWKYDNDKLPNKPANVMIDKWMPQDDILAHPNMRLFISHCGKASINEAMYYGVPILGIPMFGDQTTNLRNIVNEEWAVSLDFATFTEQSLSAAISKVINNATYRNSVKAVSDLYRDRPQHPLDLAVFWVEYVLRHNGAKHLQSHAVHLNWFQLQSYDVLVAIFLSVYVSWKILSFLFWFVIRLCRMRVEKVKPE